MLLQAILLSLLANTWLVQSSDNVIVSVIRPRLFSSKEHDENLSRFWTPEKCAGAKSMDIILSSSHNRTTSDKHNVSIGSPSRIQGSIAVNNRRAIRAITRKGQQVSTTGKVFWEAGSYEYTCSASVVSSTSLDLLVTAAHCVYDTETQTWFNNNKWVFIPDFSNNARPFKVWPARNFVVKEAWITSQDYNSDVAFVSLSTVDDKHIQNVVGSQGIAFNQLRLAYTYSFGYPSNLDSGLLLESCEGYTQKVKYTATDYIGQALPCNMGRGSSGGPWLQSVNEKTGFGYVTSVNSFALDILPNVMHGPYFGSSIESLYKEASAL